MDVLTDARRVEDDEQVQQTREKFMLLLQTERASPDFVTLYREVDELLTTLMRAEAQSTEARNRELHSAPSR